MAENESDEIERLTKLLRASGFVCFEGYERYDGDVRVHGKTRMAAGFARLAVCSALRRIRDSDRPASSQVFRARSAPGSAPFALVRARPA